MIFPWQTKEWQILWHAARANRLPHALLFIGLSGLGKAVFADCLTHSLLCDQTAENGFYCGKCHACRLIAGRVHPNVLTIDPDGATIKVDQIRNINEFLNLSGLQGDYRIVIIHSAAAMNINAANALLKILEEPTPGALIILLSETERLPITVKSRCQRITFGVPQKSQALTWLKSELPKAFVNDANLLLSLAHGAPLKALLLANEADTLKMRRDLLDTFYLLSQKQADPIQSVSLIQAMDVRTMIDVTLGWVIDLLQLKSNADESSVRNKDYMTQLKTISESLTFKKMICFMNELQQFRTYLCNGINLNKQLLIENILIRWAECG